MDQPPAHETKMLPMAWITGAGGLIGNALLEAASSSRPPYSLNGLTRQDLDLTDFAEVERKFRRDRPELIIHCAGLTRSPECESQPVLARLLNLEVTDYLAQLAHDIPFFFFSTDLVFDGKEGNYDESQAPHPLSVYGESKMLAEQRVLSNCCHTVVRTSLNGGRSPTGDRGFNEQMRLAWARGDTLNLYVDEFRSPIPAPVTAVMVWKLVRVRATGLFHLAGGQRLSRWEIGEAVANRCSELQPRIQKGSVMDYPGPPRPADTSLDCRRVEKLLGLQLPGLIQWFAAHPEAWF